MSFHTYHLITQTILHCGSGQSVGIVDQPIIRERATNLPIVPGATLRGVLRAHLSTDGEENELTRVLFGRPAKGTSDNFAGALSITDAHLLLLPVRSLYGIVAYATCPFILQRYKKALGIAIDLPIESKDKACVGEDSENIASNKVVFEELDIDAVKCGKAQEWAKCLSKVVYADDEAAQVDFQQHFVILPDDVFAYLAETATEVRTRIRMNQDTGVVDNGALWTEENLPAECVLWGSYSIHEKANKQACQFKEQDKTLLQMGGNAGVGSGLVQMVMQESDS
ncbi:type III-B CRISPR module RAMP protein Cmr4 [Vibrio palustris]|uniref:RAMP superfamily protein n=1 Tax=Vibrio palustris TaxID=1918946 RepID=A0A1R4B2V1_9VIBR|nr:type III-B CRISPR module RAMP protein Cmr4 [Vibrio palustris]SJL83231.1 RAMP superfamily protein [Vibrio palustris]